MNLFPLRTAVIAGTCAVALSFVALPAHAVTMIPSDGWSAMAQPTDPTPEPTETAPSDDATPEPAEDESGDDDGSDTTDDAGDGSAKPVETEAPAPALPAEQGHPEQHFADTVFTPKQIVKKGIEVEYTGLTAGRSYQPYYSTGRSGGELTHAKKASKKGTISFTYKLRKSERKSFGALGAVYTVGLLGLDTDLRLEQQVAVKYDSDLTWRPAKRHGGKVTLSVAVDKDSASGESHDWKRAKVVFEKKVGGKWVAVRTVRTNARGVASTTVKSGETVWRAVLKTSATVIGATSAGHRK